MYLFAHPFPSTLLGWAIQVPASIVLSYFLLSLAEYLFHRYLMHQGLPKWIYRLVPPLGTLVFEHRKLHHEKYYHQFDHEPDPVGKDINLRLGFEHTIFGTIFFVPFLLVTAHYISLVPAIVFVVFVQLHAMLWNTIHVEMHQPRHPSWTKWRIFRLLGRQHYLHHHNTRTGFNIVFPFFDYLFDTAPTASSLEDEREIERLGFAHKP